MLSCYPTPSACKFAELKEIDHCSGEKMEDDPIFSKPGYAAIVGRVPGKPVCAESFPYCPPLSRFAACDGRWIVAVGVSTTVDRRQWSWQGHQVCPEGSGD